ncbi:MAG: hypothetical protein E7637_00820 [Ruminococcaceae bacterium]|nr:hypothetical protein [Oscillospiraceae bacterium]
MKRFMILTILLLFMVGCVGCNNQTPPDVTDPITDPTADPTTEPTTDPSTTTDPSLYENNARVYVKGVELLSERNYFNEELYEYELPFLAIMKALGSTVDWQNDEKVVIVYDDITYILNPTDGTIIRDDVDVSVTGSLFVDAPGGINRKKFFILDQEFYIDINMAIGFFSFGMKYPDAIGVGCDIEYETREVFIGENLLK